MIDDCREIYRRVKNAGEYYRTHVRTLAPSDVTRIIRRQFDSNIYVLVTSRSEIVSPDMIVVSGFYDCFDDAQDLPCIQLSLDYHPNQAFYITNLIDWERLAFDLAEASGHEMIHRQQHWNGMYGQTYQSLSQDLAIKQDQEYFGHANEIAAYGFSIALESMHRNISYEDCEMYGVYQRVFVDDQKIIVKLQHYIIKYLKQMEQQSCPKKKT